MQYKIPVQIENEDTIFLGLSIRQLGIIMLFSGLGYAIFKKLEPVAGSEVALVPLGIFTVFGLVIALFKSHEMTFLPFVLNLIRMKLNVGTRVWQKGVDGFSSFSDIGFVTSYALAKGKTETKGETQEVLDSMQDQLSKI